MKTIYFVHDHQESPAARQNLLEMAGYAVRLFADATDLVVALKEEQPDLLLLDVLIEGKNGFETAKDVHGRFAERGFPIVVTSRIYRARQFRDEALRSGAQDYLLLPTKPEDFLRRIARAMDEHEQSRARSAELDGSSESAAA